MMNKKNIFNMALGLALTLTLSVGYPVTEKMTHMMSDSLITTKVKAKLATNGVTNSRFINVTTDHGIVYLKGVVDSVTQANLAVQMAEATMGVKDVDTMKLYVKSSDQPTQDTYITAKIKGVLIRESLRNENYIDLKNIIVETKNGVVYLSGFVLTEDEETRAINLAQNIHGVEKVKSAIKTRD